MSDPNEADLGADDAADVEAEGGAEGGADDEGLEGLLESDDTAAAGGEEGEAEAVQRVERRPLSRAQRQLIETRQRAQKAEREAAETAARLRDLESRLNQPSAADRARMEAEEAARLEVMTPAEQIAHFRRKDREEFQQAFNGLQFQMWEQGDKSAWDAAQARHPVYAGMADEVERRLAEERRQGRNMSRVVLARYLLGERAEQRAAGGVSKQRKAAAARVDRQRAAPGDSRGDVVATPRRNGKTAKERLEGVLI